MNLWQSFKRALGQPATESKTNATAVSKIGDQTGGKPASAPPDLPDPEELAPLPELEPAQVQAALAGERPPLLLDVREQYEWEQVRIPAALHIPMNEVPRRLGELPRSQPIVVFCAHGSRSFGVAHYLQEQGFDAANLHGGITLWRIQGGTVQTGGQ